MLTILRKMLNSSHHLLSDDVKGLDLFHPEKVFDVYRIATSSSVIIFLSTEKHTSIVPLRSIVSPIDPSYVLISIPHRKTARHYAPWPVILLLIVASHYTMRGETWSHSNQEYKETQDPQDWRSSHWGCVHEMARKVPDALNDLKMIL